MFTVYVSSSDCLQFDWVSFVKTVVESKVEPVRSIHSSEPVIVRAPHYFKELVKLIQNTDPRYTHTLTHSLTARQRTHTD